MLTVQRVSGFVALHSARGGRIVEGHNQCPTSWRSKSQQRLPGSCDPHPVRRDERALRLDALYGFLVITLPAGVITYQRPPFRFWACPLAVPAALIADVCVQGPSGVRDDFAARRIWVAGEQRRLDLLRGGGRSPAERVAGGHTDAHEPTHVTLLFLSGAKV